MSDAKILTTWVPWGNVLTSAVAKALPRTPTQGSAPKEDPPRHVALDQKPAVG